MEAPSAGKRGRQGSDGYGFSAGGCFRGAPAPRSLRGCLIAPEIQMLTGSEY